MPTLTTMIIPAVPTVICHLPEKRAKAKPRVRNNLSKFMRLKYPIIGFLLFSILVQPALLLSQIPPAEKLAPRDTAILITLPDFEKGQAIFTNSLQLQLLKDPAMKPFIDKFLGKFKTEITEPLE